MELWVLTFGEWSDRRMYGVYSSLDKAKEEAAECVKRGWGSYRANIFKASLDGDLDEYGISWNGLRGEVVRGEDYSYGLEERDEDARVDWEVMEDD